MRRDERELKKPTYTEKGMKISQKFQERVSKWSCFLSGGGVCVEEAETGVGGLAGTKKEGSVATEEMMAI